MTAPAQLSATDQVIQILHSVDTMDMFRPDMSDMSNMRTLVNSSRKSFRDLLNFGLSAPRRSAQFRVAVIGGGMCGIAMAVELRRAGIDSFTVFEAESGVGGTWRVNTYPGAAVDVPSEVYQYSYNQHKWESTHASQKELLAYLEETADRWNLGPNVRTDARVKRLVWNESEQLYDLHHDNSVEQFEIVVTATGFLVNPQWPAWPGMDQFSGSIMHHTARWNHSIDLDGLKVAVVGVGSSSAQVVPAIAGKVSELTVFQREPGWVVPKRARQFSQDELRRRTAVKRRWERYFFAIRTEWRLLTSPTYLVGSRNNRKAELNARLYIDATFAQRPDLRDAVTPKYPFGGKRRVQSDDFYEALLLANVKLVPHAVKSLNEDGLIDSNDVAHSADVIVLATGFTAWRYLEGLEVVGREGKDLHDLWRDGAYALAGMTVPGFPNLYMMYGPNTNGAGLISVNMLAEQQARRVVRDVRRMSRRRHSSVDTKRRRTEKYNQWLQKRLATTAWSTTSNYTKDPSSGKIVTQFHGPSMLYWLMLQRARLFSSVPTKHRSRVPTLLNK